MHADLKFTWFIGTYKLIPRTKYTINALIKLCNELRNVHYSYHFMQHNCHSVLIIFMLEAHNEESL